MECDILIWAGASMVAAVTPAVRTVGSSQSVLTCCGCVATGDTRWLVALEAVQLIPSVNDPQ
jgi:hypothetical protein